MKIKDYYFSKEEFTLIPTEEGVLKTSPLPDSVGKYYDSENYISHQNKRKNIFEKVYSQIQNFNFSYKKKILEKYYTTGKILDYGCGNGAFLEYLRKKSNFDLYGYEPNIKLQLENIHTYNNINDINEKYDIIMLWHVFEHIENRNEILSFLRKKLTPNGVLIIAIPNFNSYDSYYYKNYWAAWDVPRHIYHYSKNGAIQYFTKKEKFYLDKIYPLPFDSFYISILSAQYKNSTIQKIISPIIASISNIKALNSGNWSSLIYVLTNPKM